MPTVFERRKVGKCHANREEGVRKNSGRRLLGMHNAKCVTCYMDVSVHAVDRHFAMSQLAIVLQTHSRVVACLNVIDQRFQVDRGWRNEFDGVKSAIEHRNELVGNEVVGIRDFRDVSLPNRFARIARILVDAARVAEKWRDDRPRSVIRFLRFQFRTLEAKRCSQRIEDTVQVIANLRGTELADESLRAIRDLIGNPVVTLFKTTQVPYELSMSKDEEYSRHRLRGRSILRLVVLHRAV